MTTSTRAQLCALADQLERGALSPATVAATLRVIAARNLVTLPTIDPDRDDIRHWRGLPIDRLRNEVEADAWNFAAGVHEIRRRQGDATERLADALARMREVPDAPH